MIARTTSRPPACRPFPAVLAALALLAACGSGHAAPLASVPIPPPREIATPAAVESGEPALAVAPDGAVWLSWLERRGEDRHALRASRLADTTWSPPITIAEGDSFFVNWADFPRLLPLAGERLVAAWPWRSSHQLNSYELRIAQSADGGRTWTDPFVPHRDGTPTEHGFVAMASHPRGALVAWLDGRDYEYKKQEAARDTAPDDSSHLEHALAAETSLRAAVITPEGAIREDEVGTGRGARTKRPADAPGLLDARVCDCCQTAMVATKRGYLVAYRDRDAHEVRDIALMRWEPGKGRGAAARGSWTEPYPVHDDGWQLPGCPVNGPAMAASGDRVVIAWFTAAQDSERVLVSFSDDGGATFGRPIGIDGSDPLGRVDVALLEDGAALVTWLGRPEARRADLRMCRVTRAGVADPPATIASVSSARASGFPRLARSGNRVVFAWTDVGRPAVVRTAIADLR